MLPTRQKKMRRRLQFGATNEAAVIGIARRASNHHGLHTALEQVVLKRKAPFFHFFGQLFVKVIVLFNIGSVENAQSLTGDKMWGVNFARELAQSFQPSVSKLANVMVHEGKVRAPLRSPRCACSSIFLRQFNDSVD